MIHLRVVSPSDLTEKTIALLAGDPGVLNLVVLPGRVRNPDGDAIECDMLNGTANTVLPSLRRLQVDRRGSIVIEPVDLAISGRTADAATQQLGQGRERVQELERGPGLTAPVAAQHRRADRGGRTDTEVRPSAVAADQQPS
jgi:hypothetical protein